MPSMGKNILLSHCHSQPKNITKKNPSFCHFKVYIFFLFKITSEHRLGSIDSVVRHSLISLSNFSCFQVTNRFYVNPRLLFNHFNGNGNILIRIWSDFICHNILYPIQIERNGLMKLFVYLVTRSNLHLFVTKMFEFFLTPTFMLIIQFMLTIFSAEWNIICSFFIKMLE